MTRDQLRKTTKRPHLGKGLGRGLHLGQNRYSAGPTASVVPAPSTNTKGVDYPGIGNNKKQPGRRPKQRWKRETGRKAPY